MGEPCQQHSAQGGTGPRGQFLEISMGVSRQARRHAIGDEWPTDLPGGTVWQRESLR